MRIGVVTAVAAERRAVVGAIADPDEISVGPFRATAGRTAAGTVVVVDGGVGPAAASAAAATLAACMPLDLLVSAGVAGAFPSSGLGCGDVVVATECVAADLGAATDDGFLALAAMGLTGGEPVQCDARWADSICAHVRAAGHHVVAGRVLTVSTATGTDARCHELMTAHEAVAEAMEGAGVAHVAQLYGIPMVELRVISNVVGRRDLAAWDLRGALAVLAQATAAAFAEEAWNE